MNKIHRLNDVAMHDVLKKILNRHADDLFLLHGRLSKCILALTRYGVIPDPQEMKSFLDNYSNLKNGFEEGIIKVTSDDIENIINDAIKVKIDNPRALQILRYACFSFSLFKSQGTVKQNIVNYIEVADLLMNKTHEAIGFWTKKLSDKKSSRKGGKRNKINQPILQAIGQFIKSKDFTQLTTNTQILRLFQNEIDSSHEMYVMQDNEQYTVYCDDRDIISTKDNDESTTKKIKDSTLLTKYIPLAKKTISEN